MSNVVTVTETKEKSDKILYTDSIHVVIRDLPFYFYWYKKIDFNLCHTSFAENESSIFE